MDGLSYGIAVVDATGYDYSSSSSQTVAGLYAQIDKAYIIDGKISVSNADAVTRL